MGITRAEANCTGIRFSIQNDAGQEIGRAYLYVMHNSLRDQPFGLMEDVFIDESLRGTGRGSELVNEVIAEARRQGCYKLIATSRHARPRVHELYARLGFADHGLEFRVDL